MKIFLMVIMLAFVSSVFATTSIIVQHPSQNQILHSGGTDKCGCHYNRKTGKYHCHKRKKRGGDCPE